MEWTAITRAPELVLVDAPSFPAALLRRAEQIHQRLLARVGGRDEPLLYCLEATPARGLVYEMPFSLRCALEEMRAESPMAFPEVGSGVAAAKIVLERDGQYLWQQRSERVLEPGCWSWSAAGCVDRGEDVTQTIRREIEEELGVSADRFPDLRPTAVSDGDGLIVSFHATLSTPVEFTPDTGEVVGLAWAPAPPEPVAPSVRRSWPTLLPLLP